MKHLRTNVFSVEWIYWSFGISEKDGWPLDLPQKFFFFFFFFNRVFVLFFLIRGLYIVFVCRF